MFSFCTIFGDQVFWYSWTPIRSAVNNEFSIIWCSCHFFFFFLFWWILLLVILILIRTKDLIKDEKIFVEMFNKHYINIVEETSGIASKNLGNPLDPKLVEKTIREIIENYRNYSSIIKIKKLWTKNTFLTFLRPPNEIIKSLNPNKATGPDRIPLIIIKTAANVIDSHLRIL